MKIRDLLYFYRLKTWRNKLSCLRFLGYPAIGFALSPTINPWKAGLDTLAIVGVSMFAYTINDYFDFKRLGEENFLSRWMKQGASERKILGTTFLPLSLFPLVILMNSLSFLTLLTILLLTSAYSAPPLRLKERRGGALIPPLCAPLLMFQAHVSLSPSPSLEVLLLSPILFLFQSYMECLHILDVKPRPGRILTTLKAIPLGSIFLSAIFSLLNPIFLVTLTSSVIRAWGVRHVGPETDFLKLRSNVLGKAVFGEELLGYVGVGLLAHL